MWKEREINGFLGISTKRKPQINECADCSNIELRDTNGDMLSAVTPVSFLIQPDFTSEGFTLVANLGFTTHVFSQLGGVTKEVTFYFQRGTVGGYPHIAIGMYPWYYPAGGSWSNDWRWLNKIVVTTVASLSGTYGLHLTNDISLEDYSFGAIYNVTQGIWAAITSTVSGTPGTVNTTNNVTSSSWVGNTVIIMRNYEPFGVAGAYYTAKSSIALADLAFHRVLNELRIGFGSVLDRLAVGIGHKKKYFQIDTLTSGDTLTNVNNLDNIILDPYNIISDSGTFSLATSSDVEVASTTALGFPPAYYCHLTMTAILDDFNEFVVYQSASGISAHAVTGHLAIKPTIRFATMNKRVTKIRIWLALSPTSTRTEDYKLIKEIDVSKSTAIGSGVLWTLGSDGLLILTNVLTLYASGYFQADYAAYKGNTETQGLLLSATLGYTPTLQYASSWDQALVSEGATYLLNPYIDKIWKNFIMNSPISGAGAPQYDVISAENYKSLDTKDGNDIVGMELNSNQNFSIIRNNGYHQYDPVNQIPSQVINGIGGTSRLGIVNQNGAIFFPSQFDYYIIQGNQNKNISEDTIRDAYRSFTKSNILGAKENFGNSIIMYAPTENKWYTFIPGKGWIILSYTTPSYFGNSYDGTLLFMNNAGNIWKYDPLKKVHAVANTSTWTSIPIDIALLGEGITSDDRFIVGSIWMKYSSSRAITMQISYDGGLFGSDRTFPLTQTALTSGSLVVGQKYIISKFVAGDSFTNVGASSNATGIEFTATGTTPTTWTNASELTPVTFATPTKRFTSGRNCKSFQLKLSCIPSGDDVRTRICAIGINWQTFKTGLFR